MLVFLRRVATCHLKKKINTKILAAGVPFDLLNLNFVLETKVPFCCSFRFFSSSESFGGQQVSIKSDCTSQIQM